MQVDGCGGVVGGSVYGCWGGGGVVDAEVREGKGEGVECWWGDLWGCA